MINYQARWGVVTGASSGFGELFTQRLAGRGMSLVLTGRNQSRLEDVAEHTRTRFPAVEIETVAADLASDEGLPRLLSQIGDRPVEVLINNAGFGSYGPFASAAPDRTADEMAVDVSSLVRLTRALLPGMIERGSGGVLNVASTSAFQPSPYQAVYGASKAFVLTLSQALRAETRGSGVAVVALCPGPTRTGFVAALGGNASQSRIYQRLAEPRPVVDAGLRGLERNEAVIVPGWRNRLGARAVQLLPRRAVTGMAVRLLAPAGSVQPRPPIDVTNEVRINADAEQIWRVLTTVDQWPAWYEACRWVRRDQPGNHPVQPGTTFAWKAHPVALRSTVLQADAQRTFSFRADGRGLSAIHTFTLHPEADGAGVRVVSHETQTGPLPRLGHRMLAGVLRTSNQTMLADLARIAEQPPANARRVPAQ